MTESATAVRSRDRVSVIDLVGDVNAQAEQSLDTAWQEATREVPDIEAKIAGLQRPRGWGLFLIQNMVDEAHEFTEGALHTLELVMHLTDEAERSPHD